MSRLLLSLYKRCACPEPTLLPPHTTLLPLPTPQLPSHHATTKPTQNANLAAGWAAGESDAGAVFGLGSWMRGCSVRYGCAVFGWGWT